MKNRNQLPCHDNDRNSSLKMLSNKAVELLLICRSDDLVSSSILSQYLASSMRWLAIMIAEEKFKQKCEVNCIWLKQKKTVTSTERLVEIIISMQYWIEFVLKISITTIQFLTHIKCEFPFNYLQNLEFGVQLAIR